MTMVDEQFAFIKDACSLIEYAVSEGFVVTGGELYRTVDQQAIYVKTGRSKTMNSNHLKRCAIDLNFFKDGNLIYDKSQLQRLGDFWEALNPQNSWGGNWNSFKDIPHFERRT